MKLGMQGELDVYKKGIGLKKGVYGLKERSNEGTQNKESKKGEKERERVGKTGAIPRSWE